VEGFDEWVDDVVEQHKFKDTEQQRHQRDIAQMAKCPNGCLDHFENEANNLLCEACDRLGVVWDHCIEMGELGV